MAGDSTYFGYDPDAISTEPGRFVDVEADVALVEVSPGLSFRPVLGTNVLVNWVYFEPHTEAPMHAHDEEQVTIVLEGKLELEYPDGARILTKGQMAVSPPNVPHAARTEDEPCLVVDVFSPPRKALLELMDEERADE